MAGLRGLSVMTVLTGTTVCACEYATLQPTTSVTCAPAEIVGLLVILTVCICLGVKPRSVRPGASGYLQRRPGAGERPYYEEGF